MAVAKVTGVIWWKVQISHFKALFGRGTHGYTKSFLQASGGVRRTLETMYGRSPDVHINYRWPGGTFRGHIYTAVDRLEFGQWKGQAENAPRPWRIGDPATDPLITLPGDPNARIPVGANEEWHRKTSVCEPWLFAIQLEGSPKTLHLRAYLGNPPAGLEAAHINSIPAALRKPLTTSGGTTQDLGLWFDTDDLRNPWREQPSLQRTPPAANSVSSATWSTDYLQASEETLVAESEPIIKDPNELRSALQLHAATQNELADVLRTLNRRPLSPNGEVRFDLAWQEPDGTIVVVEVKGLTVTNAERQLRLGLGQLLRYRDALASRFPASHVRGVLATSGRPPGDAWTRLCSSLQIGLIYRPHLHELLQAWLGMPRYRRKPR